MDKKPKKQKIKLITEQTKISTDGGALLIPLKHNPLHQPPPHSPTIYNSLLINSDDLVFLIHLLPLKARSDASFSHQTQPFTKIYEQNHS